MGEKRALRSERLRLYRERMAGFWAHYRRSKMGLFGLSILAFFLATAISAPLLTPYDPVRDRELAEWLAYPDWIGLLDPSKANLPRNMELPMLESILTGEDELSVSNASLIQALAENGSLLIDVSSPGSTLRVQENVTITVAFDYRLDPPKTFAILVRGNLTGDTGRFLVGAVFNVVKPSGEKVMVWDSRFTGDFLPRLKQGEEFKVRSSSVELLTRLGLPPYRHVLAEKVFTEKGIFQLTATFEFTPLSPGAPSRLRLMLNDVRFLVLGMRFGLLGTDDMGRDMFSQVVHGTRVSLAVGMLASITTVLISVLVGVVAGYLGGSIDEVLMRLADIVMVLPGLPLMIVVAAVIKGTLVHIVLLLSLLGWAAGSRNIRAFVFSIRESAYVEASRARGSGSRRVIFRHIVPAVMPIALASIALAAPLAITTEAELSYLGVGGDPFIISWGKMLQYAQTRGAFQYGAWWWVMPPGLCIALLSLSFILIGHALDEILNPRLRRR